MAAQALFLAQELLSSRSTYAQTLSPQVEEMHGILDQWQRSYSHLYGPFNSDIPDLTEELDENLDTYMSWLQLQEECEKMIQLFSRTIKACEPFPSNQPLKTAVTQLRTIKTNICALRGQIRHIISSSKRELEPLACRLSRGSWFFTCFNYALMRTPYINTAIAKRLEEIDSFRLS